MIEAIKVAKSDIYRYVADPKFTVIPAAGMLSKQYAAARSGLIDMSKAGRYPDPGMPEGRPTTSAPQAVRQFPERYDGEQHTTSFSIIDKFGNAMGVTPTLGGLFGNNVVVGDSLLLNNGMHLGSTSPYPDDVNYVGAGRFRSSTTPRWCAEGRQTCLRVWIAGRRDNRADRIPECIDEPVHFKQPVTGDRVPALVARRTPNLYWPGADIDCSIETE